MITLTAEILAQFALPGTMIQLTPFERGHINDTYISVWQVGAKSRRFLHQRINHQIFKDVPGLMRNIEAVLNHVAQKIKPASDYRVLELVPTRSGANLLQDHDGNFWRTYNFIEGTASFDVCQNEAHAYEAAKTLGWFLTALQDLPATKLIEPIPRFQSITFRLEELDRATGANSASRLNDVRETLDYALKQREFLERYAGLINSGEIKTRPTHADPKINNVLMDAQSGRGVTIVDLDTCMPGTILYDFGDLVRSTGVQAAEDETDLTKVKLDLKLFTALARGFLADLAPTLTSAEREWLPLAPRVIALNLGNRFLADHLAGDTYFKVHHPGHNLERARAQYQIARSMAELESQMRAQTDQAFKRAT